MSRIPNYSFQEAKDAVLIDLKTGVVPLLLGIPGIGKTSFVKDLGIELGATKTYTLSLNTMADRSDLTGVAREKDANGNYMQVFFPHADIRAAINEAQASPDKPVILLLDEFNRGDVSVQLASMTLLSERRIGTYEFPDNIVLIFAGNDSGNITPVDSASISRMSLYRISPDTSEWLNIMGDSLNPFIKETLTKHTNDLVSQPSEENMEDENADLLLDEESEDFVQFATPRTWDYLNRWLNAANIVPNQQSTWLDDLKSPLISESKLERKIRGTIGYTPAADHLLEVMRDDKNNISVGTTDYSKLAFPTELRELQSNNASDLDVKEWIQANSTLNKTALTFVLLAGTDLVDDNDSQLTVERLTQLLRVQDDADLNDALTGVVIGKTNMISQLAWDVIKNQNLAKQYVPVLESLINSQTIEVK